MKQAAEEYARTAPAKTEDAGLQGALGYPTRQLNTPKRHVNGSRNDTARERGVNYVILPLLQNIGENH